MKVLFLFDVPEPADPDARITGASFLREDRSADASVLKCLRRLGHEVDTLPVYDDVAIIVERIKRFQPDVVFNAAESFYYDRALEPNLCGLLELLRVRYTGAGPEALLMCKDKALAKKLLTYHHIHVPHFRVSQRAHPVRSLKRFDYPAFIKPATEDSSDGISEESLVHDPQQAIERVRYLHRELNCDVLIEEYIDGRELYLSVLGNRQLTVFPYREIFFEGIPEGGPKFATARAKWDMNYRDKWNIMNGPADALPEGMDERLYEVATKVYRTLKVRGFGRIDVRIKPDGRVYVLEANPNPSLDQDEDFAQAAYMGGVSYEDLIQQILDLA